jgi:glycosyl hydrolase family 99/calcineurin-like phosphoesterase family protein
MFTATQGLHKKIPHWLHFTLVMILITSAFMPVISAGAAPAADTQPAFPIRAAFYYPWFPEAWNQQGFNPFTNYTPSLGFYDGGAQSVIKQQIAAMQYGGIQAGIASWWGQGTKTDSRISALLQAASGTPFRWSIYHEQESLGNPSIAQITNDLTYLRDHYGNDPSFLRIDGRFVVFVYADGTDACGMADRWTQANTVGAYLVLKVFSGYRTCASQPDGWHQYSPAVAADSQKGFSYAIGPGFWQKGLAVRLARDLTRWNQNVRDMVASGAPFQLITTFNEWGEGTSVESAQEWASSSGYGAYLDALHNNGNQPPTTPIASTATATRAPTLVPSTATSIPTQVQSTATLAPTQAPTTAVPASPTLPAPASPTTAPAKTATPITSTDPVIAAAGDIACDPADGSFNSGNGTANNCRQKAVSDLLVGTNLAAVLTLGDNQYENATLTKFQQSFDPSWGRVKNIIRPAVGNHEYQTAGAADYYSYFGAAAGDPAKGYYSYEIGAWHIIALNSNCSQVGGCGVGSAQEQWLKADLAAHPNACTLAYWHHPRFSSGQHGNSVSYDAFWKALYVAGADVVLNGHDHDYERFALQNPSAVADPNGIQQFVVGTGGKNHYALTAIQANSAVRNTDTYGVLKLTLHPTSYDWQFVAEAGKTFTDSGTLNCRNAAVPGSTPLPSPTQTSVPANTPVSTQTTAPVNTPASTQTLAPANTPVLTQTAVPTISAPTQTAVGTNFPTAIPTQSSTTGTFTFTPGADAYVTAAIPNTNYGASKQMRVDAAPIVMGYMIFNVQGVNGTIASATLRIYANSSSSKGCTAYGVPDTTWIEKSITYNTAPPLGAVGGSSGAFAGAKWITLDVTALVTGNGVISLAVTGLNSTAISLGSRESGTTAPQLVIVTQ